MGERRRASTKVSLMEMSGFSETQVQVREAVGKICEDFPEVGIVFFVFIFSLVSWCSWAFIPRPVLAGHEFLG